MKLFAGFLKKYKFFLGVLFVNLIILIFWPKIGKISFISAKDQLIEMVLMLPPVFILLGLLDIWVEKETMMKYMGKEAGIKGGLIAATMGAAAAGPLYIAFPIAATLLKKGGAMINVFIFIGVWSTTKLPMILFEAANLGVNYTLLRQGCNIIGILCIAFIMDKTLSETERKTVYENAEKKA